MTKIAPGSSVERILGDLFQAQAQTHPFARKVSPSIWIINDSIDLCTVHYMSNKPGGSKFFAMFALGSREDGKRVWISNFRSLNAAAAWAHQRRLDLVKFNRTLTPLPNPGTQNLSPTDT